MLGRNEALEAVQAHVNQYPIHDTWGKTELVLVPIARGHNPDQVPFGQGYDYRLAWTVRPSFDRELRHFEALVDAHVVPDPRSRPQVVATWSFD